MKKLIVIVFILLLAGCATYPKTNYRIISDAEFDKAFNEIMK